MLHVVCLVPLVENLHMYELTVIYYKSGTKTTVPFYISFKIINEFA